MLLNPPHKNVSQIEYYQQRILTDARFGMLGWLLNEYLVDIFSSTEDNCLNFITACKVGLQHDVNSMKPSKLRVDVMLGECTCQHLMWDL